MATAQTRVAGSKRLTEKRSGNIFSEGRFFFRITRLPLRSTVGQLPLEQHIGVRIPEGQPTLTFLEHP